MDWLGIEPESSRWEAGCSLPDPWYGQTDNESIPYSSVSRLLLIPEARIWSQDTPYRILCGQGSIGTGFLRVFRVSLSIIMPSVLYIYPSLIYYLDNGPLRRCSSRTYNLIPRPRIKIRCREDLTVTTDTTSVTNWRYISSVLSLFRITGVLRIGSPITQNLHSRIYWCNSLKLLWL
jgi:hypothetical protein